MIYTAVYSSIPVYEMMCRGIAVMKRRSDHCLNATQILKVAGVEKGRRTKILEREVLTGEHEKVQGGYGKYQGTWVPFHRGIELAQQYGVESYLRPLFDYQPTQEEGSVDRTPTKEQAMSAFHRNKSATPQHYTPSTGLSVITRNTHHMTNTDNTTATTPTRHSNTNLLSSISASIDGTDYQQHSSRTRRSSPPSSILRSSHYSSTMVPSTPTTSTQINTSSRSMPFTPRNLPTQQQRSTATYSNIINKDQMQLQDQLSLSSSSPSSSFNNNVHNYPSSSLFSRSIDSTGYRTRRYEDTMVDDEESESLTKNINDREPNSSAMSYKRTNEEVFAFSSSDTMTSSKSTELNTNRYYYGTNAKRVKRSDHLDDEAQLQSPFSSPRPIRPSFPPLSPVPFTPAITTLDTTASALTGSHTAIDNEHIDDDNDNNTSANLMHSRVTTSMASKDEQRSALMSIFLNDDPNYMPDVLLNDDSLDVLDVNIVIDDQGHSALHWAASLARLQVVRLLLARGADVMRVNYAGESALIRAVLVTNNYERDIFPQLLRLLGPSVLLRDGRDRTVFHHIALHAGIKGRVMAARYYMSCLLSYLIEEEESVVGGEGGLATLLNAQDTNGDTALCVAARVGCRMMMEQLIEAGARRDLHNRYDLGPDDFGVMNNLYNMMSRKEIDGEDYGKRQRPDTRTRTTAGDARSRELLAVVERLVTDMDNDFDTALRLKKEQLLEAQQRLREATHELADLRGKAQQSRARGRYLSQLELRIKTLTVQLNERLEKKEKSNEYNKDNTADHEEEEEEEEELLLNPTQPLSLAQLRLQLAVYETRDTALKEQIEQWSTRGRDMEKEARYRRLIAACSRVPLTLVDQQLDTLTTAVESDGDALDLERVEDFLRNLSTASTAARSQPFYDSQQSTTKLDDLSQASTTLPSMTELASTAELPLVKDGDLIEEDHISTDALIPIDPSSPTIELAVKEEDTNTIFTPMETS